MVWTLYKSIFGFLMGICFFTTFSASADPSVNSTANPWREILIMKTSSNAAGDSQLKILVDDEDAIHGFRYYFPPQEPRTFQLSDLEKGVVLYRQSGFDVTKISSKDFDVKKGGTINLVYLTNGLTKEYETLPVYVEYNKSWMVFVKDRTGNHYFSSLYLKARKLLGRFIGIEEIIIKDEASS